MGNGYKKFLNKTQRILFLYNDYFLQNEIIETFKSDGHEVLVVTIHDDGKEWSDTLFSSILSFKPDYIFSTNFMGLDVEGKILSSFVSLQIPFVSWFLDDFRFLISEQNYIKSDFITIFTYDKSHVSILKELGFENAVYLPTACTFLSNPQKSKKKFKLENKITFVGGTFLKTAERWYDDSFKELYSKLDFSNLHSFTSVFEITAPLESHFSDQFTYYSFVSYVGAKLSYQYRKESLLHIDQRNLAVFGDNLWRASELECDIFQSTHDKNDLKSIFQESKMIINVSSKQHVQSVNMRLFDVPYCGGFLLSDYNPIMDELFVADKELITYRDTAEMIDKISFYSNNSAAREVIINAACEKIHKKHKLIHRINLIKFILNKTYKRMYL